AVTRRTMRRSAGLLHQVYLLGRPPARAALTPVPDDIPKGLGGGWCAWRYRWGADKWKKRPFNPRIHADGRTYDPTTAAPSPILSAPISIHWATDRPMTVSGPVRRRRSAPRPPRARPLPKPRDRRPGGLGG